MISDVMAVSAKDSHPVPLVLVCNVVMNPHKFLPVFPCDYVALISVASESCVKLKLVKYLVVVVLKMDMLK